MEAPDVLNGSIDQGNQSRYCLAHDRRGQQVTVLCDVQCLIKSCLVLWGTAFDMIQSVTESGS